MRRLPEEERGRGSGLSVTTIMNMVGRRNGRHSMCAHSMTFTCDVIPREALQDICLGII